MIFFFFCNHVSVERTSEQMVMEQRLMYYRETGGAVVVTREEERVNFTKWSLETKERQIYIGCRMWMWHDPGDLHFQNSAE